MSNREVMQQALEALEHCCFSDALVTDKDFAADAIYTLRTALEQQAEPPPEWESIKNILDEYGLDAIAFVAAWKAVKQQAKLKERNT